MFLSQKVDKMKGSDVEFLVENCVQNSSGKYNVIGRSFFQSPEIDGNIKILSDKSLKLGGFYKAEIKGVRGYNIKAAMENINELGQ
jgi:ribosomal protein S12 methylthiotransferase